jgi:beta-glucosidase
MLAPAVNIYRAPMNSRNFEYFGEDPYLASRMAVSYIRGMQSQGVVATVKHFAANNSDYDRHNINSIIDERTLREIYLPAFEAAVKEGQVGAVMDSYNLVNGEHSTQSEWLNTEVLKKEWGFRGILMSDWWSTYDAVAAANSGLNVEMPYAEAMTPRKLRVALDEGQDFTGDS